MRKKTRANGGSAKSSGFVDAVEYPLGESNSHLSAPEKQYQSPGGGATGGALADAQLISIAEAWPKLNNQQRQQVVELVDLLLNSHALGKSGN